MTENAPDDLDFRVLLLAPTRRDAETTRGLLAEAGVRVDPCTTIARICREAERGAGTVLLTAEAIVADAEGGFTALLRAQEPWSELPLLVLTPPGPDSPRLLDALDAVGPMTLLKRPLPVSSIVSAVRTALRDRRRQYALRDHLAERGRTAALVAVEREQYRVTLSSIGDGVIATDVEGRVTFLNAVAEELTGWDAASARGRRLAEVFRIVNETTRAEVPNPALRALRDGVVVGLANHTVLIARDGTEKPLDDSAAPIRDAAGDVVGAVLVFRDITEKKEAERAIRERERHAETILESISDGFFAVDRAWRFTYANRQAELILGREPGDLLGLVLWDVYPGLAGSELEKMYRRVAATGSAESSTVYYPDHDRWYAAHAYPAPDGITVYFGDISVQHRAEERVRASEERRKLALGAAELGAWHLDPRTWTLTTDERFRAIFGLDGECDYARAVAAIHPDDRDRVRAAVEAATRPDDPAPFTIEYRVVRPDGSERWVSAKGVANFRSGKAGPMSVSLDGIVVDITDRKVAEAHLRANEERYRVLVNSTWDVVYRMSPDWSEMQPLDGRGLIPSAAEPERDWMRLNLPASEHPCVSAAIAEAIAAKGMFELEHGVNRADGSPGWTFSRAVPILDAAGNIVEWFGTARDVTERKRTEEELARVTAESQRRKRLYETVLSATPDFIYVFSLDHRVLYANDALIAMWGRGHEGAIGKTFLEIGYQPWHAEMHDREIDEVRATGRPIRGEVPFEGTHGRRIYDYIFVPVFGADGDVEAVAGTTRDVTERKGMEVALREADRKKDDFLALLAHELRNPLAPIRHGLQVMKFADGKETRARAREMMERQLAHMVRLIDDLLDISRISRNKMELRLAEIDLADAVASAVETAQPAIEAAGHELTVSLPDEAVRLRADLTRLAQVFCNLLTNSAKYTEPGGRIRLSAESRPGSVAVVVRDTGIGIPAASLPKIFDMFSQVDRSIERSSGGLGIGLALVKGLVEMHGGTVAAESPGRGSTFTVTLPTITATPAFAQTASPSDAESARTGPGRRILVVDDNRDSGESLAMMLELLGHEVAIAYDGLEAIERAEAVRPEVILMDVGMPNLNGLDATRRIRAESWGKPMTVIALTGWGQEEDRARTREAGCDGHLVKPVDLPDLKKLLEVV